MLNEDEIKKYIYIIFIKINSNKKEIRFEI